jgi:DNA-binding transcriptional LysR family regulator
MRINELAELTTFVMVAEERSFRRAAARLSLTPSTLSHSLRSLEERLGVRLLNRTTRSVSPTDAGQTLLDQLMPAFSAIEAAVRELDAFRARPRGRLRLNVPSVAAMTILAPIFQRFAEEYPEVTLDVAVSGAYVGKEASGFDAGIRLGYALEKDMTAVRVSPDFVSAVVGSPKYFALHSTPKTPRELHDHLCINYRLNSGDLYRWKFGQNSNSFVVQVKGPLIVDSPNLQILAALDGVGLAYVAESMVTEHLASGALIRVLADWAIKVQGFYLYYPGRRQTPVALKALVDILRRNAGNVGR